MELNKQFLLSYAPADDMFTTMAEAITINRSLVVGCDNLRKLSTGKLQELRDEVVKFYSTKTRDVMRYMHAMQSIVTVIDTLFYNPNSEIFI